LFARITVFVPYYAMSGGTLMTSSRVKQAGRVA